MKIGLYFGSFNPIHHGHLIIAAHVVNETVLQQVWFVVSPQNPFKQNHTLLNEYHRLHLVKLAIEGENKLRATDIEFKLPKPSYTIASLQYLEEKYPEHQFAIILGSDSLQNLDKWKNAEVIMGRYELYVYKRAGYEVRQDLPVKYTILDAPPRLTELERRQFQLLPNLNGILHELLLGQREWRIVPFHSGVDEHLGLLRRLHLKLLGSGSNFGNWHHRWVSHAPLSE